ncbi:potassium channel family protein [Demequina sp.]|uniref:potassium channel family protein n=1 Tax=Demequina sp. TaxID=2050685 RepID=UPI0025F163C7|nr:potassium channel family protein [Demequina sp.]
MSPSKPKSRRADTPDDAVEPRSSLWLLLVTLVVLQFGYPISLLGQGWTAAYLMVYAGAVAYVVRTAVEDPRRSWPLLVAAGGLVAGVIWFATQPDDISATRGMLVGVGVLQAALLFSLLRVLVNPPARLAIVDLLLVAMSAYLLLGGVFGALAGIMELTSPGSFIDQTAGDGSPVWQTLVYGSYVTLATLGFGDVVPVSPWARSMWSLEAVIGPLFVAVVIARLVGVANPLRRNRDGAQ